MGLSFAPRLFLAVNIAWSVFAFYIFVLNPDLAAAPVFGLDADIKAVQANGGDRENLKKVVKEFGENVKIWDESKDADSKIVKGVRVWPKYQFAISFIVQEGVLLGACLGLVQVFAFFHIDPVFGPIIRKWVSLWSGICILIVLYANIIYPDGTNNDPCVSHSFKCIQEHPDYIWKGENVPPMTAALAGFLGWWVAERPASYMLADELMANKQAPLLGP